MPKAKEVITTPAMVKISLSVLEINRKLDMLRAITNIIRRLQTHKNSNDNLRNFNMPNAIHQIADCKSLRVTLQIGWCSTHFFTNGKNGHEILMSTDGTISANSKTPVDGVSQTFGGSMRTVEFPSVFESI